MNVTILQLLSNWTRYRDDIGEEDKCPKYNDERKTRYSDLAGVQGDCVRSLQKPNDYELLKNTITLEDGNDIRTLHLHSRFLKKVQPFCLKEAETGSKTAKFIQHLQAA